MATASFREAYLPLYVGDFLASTAEWTGEEQGLYLLLLGYQWSIGSLPADPEKLCRMIRWDSRLFAKCWRQVAEKFPRSGDRLQNPRLEQHRDKARGVAQKRSEAGKAGARERWQTDGNCHADANGEGIASATDLLMATGMPSKPNQTKPNNPNNLSNPIPEIPSSTSSTAPDEVAEVFDHWRQAHGHQRAQLDPKRRKVIREALARYSVADLCRAISGYRNSPHHMGENDRGTRYDDIELFLRDAKHIDAGLRFADDPPRTGLSKLTRRNVAAIADWQPPEVRRAAE